MIVQVIGPPMMLPAGVAPPPKTPHGGGGVIGPSTFGTAPIAWARTQSVANIMLCPAPRVMPAG